MRASKYSQGEHPSSLLFGACRPSVRPSVCPPDHLPFDLSADRPFGRRSARRFVRPAVRRCAQPVVQNRVLMVEGIQGNGLHTEICLAWESNCQSQSYETSAQPARPRGQITNVSLESRGVVKLMPRGAIEPNQKRRRQNDNPGQRLYQREHRGTSGSPASAWGLTVGPPVRANT